MCKLVTVVIPTYQRSDTLPRAIDSVLNQNYKNVEIIVVDDNDPASSFRKQTELVMDGYKKVEKVKYIQHDYNKNGSAARNTGFKNSNGEYLMFLDDDDEFLSNKIQKQVECLNNRDKSWGACYTSYIRKKDNKTVMTCGENREGNLLVEELKRNLFVHAGSNLMVRRKVFEELNGFDETFERNQDVEFLVRLLRKNKLAYVDVIGLAVYIHPRVMKKSLEELTIQYLEKFDGYIKELKKDDQEQIYKMLKLQVFRSKMTNRSHFPQAINMVVQKDVSVLDAFRYVIHLFYRKLTKKSCGFNLRLR
ncbi:Glycosyltransferase involved in cell wall bisynthesis [Terribacillus saccharophilus]|uniref:Glycosyltransferase involved in cell wall bisynthesis n=1 Tax=Terribacillus saccharophilus TaxID=361277 RepID=A0AAX2EFH6_9BACI|nr:Glycosyltransferase involved in cell wall bisynthesis [Terribacillus saccharophilus]